MSAILLAKWAGAWVAATVRKPEHVAIAHAAGADLVLDLHTENVPAALRSATDGAGVDRIVDVNLLANLEIDLASIAPGGVISAYAMDSAVDTVQVPLLRAMIAGCVFRFIYIYSVPADAKRAAIADITACLTTGHYRLLIGLMVPLDQIVRAHEAQEARAISGKILVRTRFYGSGQ